MECVRRMLDAMERIVVVAEEGCESALPTSRTNTRATATGGGGGGRWRGAVAQCHVDTRVGPDPNPVVPLALREAVPLGQLVRGRPHLETWVLGRRSRQLPIIDS